MRIQSSPGPFVLVASSTKLPALAGLLRDRDRRIAAISTVSVALGLTLSLLMPAVLFALSPVVLGVPGVLTVEPDAREERLRIVTASSDVAAPIAAALATAGLTLTHLRRRGTDLLELYRRYVPEGIDGR